MKNDPVGRAHQQELLLVAHPLRRVDVAGDDRPPVLLARRVGVHDDAGPRRPAHRRVGVAVDAAGAGVDDFLGHLPRLVDPHAGEIEREKLLHVLRRIERQEDDLAVDLGAVGHRVAQVVGERRAPQEAAEILGHPAQPGLDRGELELGESVAHDRPARVARAAGDVAGRIFRQVRRLLLGALQDLVHAQHALARAERAANAAHEVVRLHEGGADRAGRHERLGLGRQRPQVDLGLGLAPRERDAGHYFRVRVGGAGPGLGTGSRLRAGGSGGPVDRRRRQRIVGRRVGGRRAARQHGIGGAVQPVLAGRLGHRRGDAIGRIAVGRRVGQLVDAGRAGGPGADLPELADQLVGIARIGHPDGLEHELVEVHRRVAPHRRQAVDVNLDLAGHGERLELLETVDLALEQGFGLLAEVGGDLGRRRHQFAGLGRRFSGICPGGAAPQLGDAHRIGDHGAETARARALPRSRRRVSAAKRVRRRPIGGLRRVSGHPSSRKSDIRARRCPTGWIRRRTCGLCGRPARSGSNRAAGAGRTVTPFCSLMSAPVSRSCWKA